jgi:hypothetical protein
MLDRCTYLLHLQYQLVYLSSLLGKFPAVADRRNPSDVRSVPEPLASSINQQHLGLEVVVMQVQRRIVSGIDMMFPVWSSAAASSSELWLAEGVVTWLAGLNGGGEKTVVAAKA